MEYAFFEIGGGQGWIQLYNFSERVRHGEPLFLTHGNLRRPDIVGEPFGGPENVG